MKTINHASRLTLLASLIAATAFTAACSSQQVKPAPVSVHNSPLEHSVIDATPQPVDTQDSAIADSIPMETNVTLVTSANISQEPLEMAEVDNSDDEPNTTMDTSRPGRLVFKFGFNQSQLDEDNRQIVEQHGRFLAEHPEIKLVINGHSDTQGDSRYNDILAQKRAEHVADLLMNQGVTKEQIEILSWGSSAPIADAQHHRDQRRVELNYVDEYVAQSTTE